MHLERRRWTRLHQRSLKRHVSKCFRSVQAAEMCAMSVIPSRHRHRPCASRGKWTRRSSIPHAKNNRQYNQCSSLTAPMHGPQREHAHVATHARCASLSRPDAGCFIDGLGIPTDSDVCVNRSSSVLARPTQLSTTSVLASTLFCHIISTVIRGGRVGRFRDTTASASRFRYPLADL
jgi:hypothetical protein